MIILKIKNELRMKNLKNKRNTYLILKIRQQELMSKKDKIVFKTLKLQLTPT